MSGKQGFRQRLHELSKAAPAVVLIAVMLLAELVIGATAWGLAGWQGLKVSGIACLVCLVSGLTGIVVAKLLKSRINAAQAMMASTMLRMGLPLAVFLALYLKSQAWVDAGLVPTFVLFYLLMLAVETWLVVVAIDDSTA